MSVNQEYYLLRTNQSPERISLKKYQCIRRRWSLRQIFSGLGLVLILLWIGLSSDERGHGLALIEGQTKRVTYLSGGDNLQDNIGLASTYVNRFCDGKGCQQNNTGMVISLIQLMSQQHTWTEQFTFFNNSAEMFPVVVTKKANVNIHNSLELKKRIDWRQLVSSFSRHILKQVDLYALKRLKLTTPKQNNNELIDIFWSIFGFQDQYHGIDRLFDDGNIIWEVNVPYSAITIASNSQIQPQILQIDFLTDQLETLILFGVNINLRKQIFNVVALGSYPLNHGLNKIHCSLEACSQKYSMIRLVFSKIRIKSIKLYQIHEL